MIDGGKMIIPIQNKRQFPWSDNFGEGVLKLITKENKTYSEKSLIGVRFVPLINSND